MNHERMALDVSYSSRWAIGRRVWNAEAQRGGPEAWVRAKEAQDAAMREEGSRQCDLIRDVFNLFRTVTLEPAWRTPAVMALARTVYDERRFSELSILADALEEAGC